ncbi:PF05957 family protein [Bordetella pertussis STO1-CHOC-0018]|nr:PF05957 family protein [Bordetella pertussis STO1-CHOC-0018]
MAARRSDEATKEKLIDSVKTSLNDAETLLREAASTTGDKATELRERALASVRRTREALYDAQDAVLERGRRAARATDDYVHDNPWQAISIAGVTRPAARPADQPPLITAGRAARPPRHAQWVCVDRYSAWPPVWSD